MNPEEIIKNIRILLNTDIDEIRGQSRKRPLPDYRAIIAHVLYYEYEPYISVIDIGVMMNRDHSSISHYLTKITEVKEVEKQLSYVINELSKTKLLNYVNNYEALLNNLHKETQKVFTRHEMIQFAKYCALKIKTDEESN